MLSHIEIELQPKDVQFRHLIWLLLAKLVWTDGSVANGRVGCDRYILGIDGRGPNVFSAVHVVKEVFDKRGG